MSIYFIGNRKMKGHDLIAARARTTSSIAKSESVCFFVREQTKDEYGRTMGFVNYGEVDYISHTGSQPMDITWKLKSQCSFYGQISS